MNNDWSKRVELLCINNNIWTEVKSEQLVSDLLKRAKELGVKIKSTPCTLEEGAVPFYPYHLAKTICYYYHGTDLDPNAGKDKYGPIGYSHSEMSKIGVDTRNIPLIQSAALYGISKEDLQRWDIEENKLTFVVRE